MRLGGLGGGEGFLLWLICAATGNRPVPDRAGDQVAQKGQICREDNENRYPNHPRWADSW